MPPRLAELVAFFEHLPEQERRENLAAFAEQARSHEPRADEAFESLSRLLGDRATHAAAIAIDWDRFLAQLPTGSNRSFFRPVAPTTPQAKPGKPVGGAITARVRALPAGQRRAALLSHLRERALHVLGRDPDTVLDPRRPLKEVGLDSLTAVELRNTLAQSLGQRLPATLLFDYPSLETLAGHLATLLGIDEPRPVTPATPAVDRAAAEVGGFRRAASRAE